MEGSSRRLGKREPEDDLETKPILKKHKEVSEHKEETVEGLDEPPYFVMSLAERKKTLFLSNLSLDIKISDIMNFFEVVGKVVQVRLIVSETGKNLGYGSVEFASSQEAKKAQETKNGKYLCGNKITLDVAKISPHRPRPRPVYCIEHKFWPKDYYLLRETFPIKEEETPPHFLEAIAARENTLLIANLSPQTKMEHIITFFKAVANYIRVRLIVNHEGKHVGYGFVQFPTAKDTKKALESMGGKYLHDHKIFLVEAKTGPDSPRLKYSLAEKLWYEDYLLQESLRVEEYEMLEGGVETPSLCEALAVRKKMLHLHNVSYKTEISDIIEFFKDIGEIVHVRRVVNKDGNLIKQADVMFASANEAKKGQEMKHCRLLCGHVIMLGMPAIDPQIKYCIDHKVWYEDYLRRENLLIEEDEAVEGLDETHDFFEEVTARKRTLFMYNLPNDTEIREIINYFKDVGEVLSVRLSVDSNGQNVGCGFVEFASANEAKKALNKKEENFREGDIDYLNFLKGPGYIRLSIPEIVPYPMRPKYNLAEKQWYENEETDLETKPKKEQVIFSGCEDRRSTLNLFCGKKITFSEND